MVYLQFKLFIRANVNIFKRGINCPRCFLGQGGGAFHGRASSSYRPEKFKNHSYTFTVDGFVNGKPTNHQED